MYAYQNGASQRSLALITEVQNHLAKLQRENPMEAAFFRYRLAEVLQSEGGDVTADAQLSRELQKMQLFTLRHQEEERARLAKRLREGPGQLLANAAMELAACLPLLDTDTELVRQGLQALEEELRAGLDRLRHILSGLEPPRLMQELGLFESLQMYAKRLVEENGVTVETRFPELPPQFPPTIEIGVYRVMQEALTNAVEHGQASTVILSAEQGDGGWRFTVQDDGTGFEPTHVSYARGLINMYEWAKAFDGTLEIQSKPGHGTTVALTIGVPEVQAG